MLCNRNPCYPMLHVGHVTVRAATDEEKKAYLIAVEGILPDFIVVDADMPTVMISDIGLVYGSNWPNEAVWWAQRYADSSGCAYLAPPDWEGVVPVAPAARELPEPAQNETPQSFSGWSTESGKPPTPGWG